MPIDPTQIPLHSAWVLTYHFTDQHREPETVAPIAVASSLGRAQQAATEHQEPNEPTLEWVQNHDGSWTTYWADGSCYRAYEFEIQH